MKAPAPTQGPRPGTRPSGNAASRYFFLFLVGLVVGIIATVMALRALDARKDHYPDSVMQVMSAHIDALSGAIKQNRCTATDTLPHLQTLRVMANDIEPAFGDNVLANPPIACPAAQSALEEIGGKCKACHKEFRS